MTKYQRLRSIYRSILVYTAIFSYILSFSLYANDCVYNVDALLSSKSNNSKLTQLPNTPISKIGTINQFKLKNNIGTVLYKKFLKFQNADREPHIMMSAVEFGKINLGGVDFTSKVGGLAVVINDMTQELSKFLSKIRTKAKVSFIFMAFKEIPEGKFIKELTIKMGENDFQKVKIFSWPGPDKNTTYYFVDHSLFRNISISTPYTIDEYLKVYYSGASTLEQAYAYGLYNKAIVEMNTFLKPTVYHAHDYHTALSAVKIGKTTPSVLTIHNGGYQGVFWTDNFGGARRGDSLYENGVPLGNWEEHLKLLNILGISRDEFLRYFEGRDQYGLLNGDINLLKGALSFLEERYTISGIPVSQGYADELKWSKEIIFEKISKEKNGLPPLVSQDVFIPNGNTHFGNVDGIENGLSDAARIENKLEFKSKKASEVDERLPEEVRIEWEKGFDFGDISTSNGVTQALKEKARIKKLLQITAGIEVDPDKPIFSLLTRIVDQKKVEVFAESIEHIVKKGGQVVIGGTPGDEAGKEVVKMLEKLELKYPSAVKFYNLFADKELGQLIQAGGDFFPITSKFEPCGLTDIEAMWRMNIPITRKTGGLIKGGDDAVFMYSFNDSSDLKGEIEVFKSKIDEIMDLFKNDPTTIDQMRITGRKKEFSWDIALSRYFENYRTAYLSDMIFYLSQKHMAGETNLLQAESIINSLFKTLPKELIDNYKRVLIKKEQKGPIEKLVMSLNSVDTI